MRMASLSACCLICGTSGFAGVSAALTTVFAACLGLAGALAGVVEVEARGVGLVSPAAADAVWVPAPPPAELVATCGCDTAGAYEKFARARKNIATPPKTNPPTSIKKDFNRGDIPKK